MSSKIRLSNDEAFVELWHNGHVIQFVQHGRLHENVAFLEDHLRKHAGQEEELVVDKRILDKMQAADANFQRMAFGAEWR